MSSRIWETQLTPEEVTAYKQLFQAAAQTQLHAVSGLEAVQFFARSGLPNELLSQIWETADEHNLGYLTVDKFAIALKLIACAQNNIKAGQPVLSTVTPLPRIKGIQLRVNSDNYASTITPADRNKYLSIYRSQNPQKNGIEAQVARGLFLKSKLSNEQLAHVWNLADIRQCGYLNETEFIIAMHYIAQLMNKSITVLPPALPQHVYAAALGDTKTTVQRTRSVRSPTPQEKAKYDPFFERLDKDKKGYVTKADAFVFFKNSRLPEKDIHSLWNSVDKQSTGILDASKFALVMSSIHNQLSGQVFSPSATKPDEDLLGDFGDNGSLAQETTIVNQLKNQIDSKKKATDDLVTQHSQLTQSLNILMEKKENLVQQSAELGSRKENESTELQQLKQTLEQESSLWNDVKAEAEAAENNLKSTQSQVEQLKKQLKDGDSENEQLRSRVHKVQTETLNLTQQLDFLYAEQERKKKLAAEKEEADRVAAELKKKQEEEERLKKEEEERLKKEEEERLRKEEEERLRKEEEERLKKEEEERLKKEEEECLKKEEEERLKKEEEERLKKEEEERLKKEEERLRKEEEERLRKEEEERLRKEEEERLKKEEEERLNKEEEERLKKEEEDRLKLDEEKRLKKEEEDRLAKENEDRVKAEEEECLKKENDDRIKREEEECLKVEEKTRLKKEEEDRTKAEEETCFKKEAEDRVKAEEEERLKKENEERLKKEHEDHVKAEEEERLKKEEEERLKKEHEDHVKAEEEERLKKEEEERLKKENEERLKKEHEDHVKAKEEERLKKENEECLEKEEDMKTKDLEKGTEQDNTKYKKGLEVSDFFIEELPKNDTKENKDNQDTTVKTSQPENVTDSGNTTTGSKDLQHQAPVEKVKNNPFEKLPTNENDSVDYFFDALDTKNSSPKNPSYRQDTQSSSADENEFVMIDHPAFSRSEPVNKISEFDDVFGTIKEEDEPVLVNQPFESGHSSHNSRQPPPPPESRQSKGVTTQSSPHAKKPPAPPPPGKATTPLIPSEDFNAIFGSKPEEPNNEFDRQFSEVNTSPVKTSPKQEQSPFEQTDEQQTFKGNGTSVNSQSQNSSSFDERHEGVSNDSKTEEPNLGETNRRNKEVATKESVPETKGKKKKVNIMGWAKTLGKKDSDKKKKKKEKELNNVSKPASNTPPAVVATPAPSSTDNTVNKTLSGTVQDSHIAELVNMGFDTRAAREALDRYDQNMEKATNFLLDQS